MQCKFHPEKKADFFCSSCNAPLCSSCIEKAHNGQVFCFQCAMFHSISEISSSITDKRDTREEMKKKRGLQWGPFQYFVILSSVMILVMWGVILFGGSETPSRSADFTKKGRVLLFMVDGALKRYAHYEGNLYPEELSALAPRYLSLKENELFYLDNLIYQRDTEKGYLLSLADPKDGEMNIILSPKGIEYTPPSNLGT